MAEQRQPFRFRLPWLSAPPPPPSRPTSAAGTETVSIQRLPFRPPELAQTQAPNRVEQVEFASPPLSPIRPPTQFRTVFVSPLLSPRIPTEITSPPFSPASTENQSPKLNLQPEEPKPVVSQSLPDRKVESKPEMNSNSDRAAINEGVKEEAKKERRELEKKEKTVTEHLTEGSKSHTRDRHGKLFPLNKKEPAGKKEQRKEKRQIKALNFTHSKEEKASPQREVREDISKFVHNLTTGFSSVDIPVTVVTLIGDNRGASMEIGSDSGKTEEPIHIHRSYKLNPDESSETADEVEGSHRKNQKPISDDEEEERKTFINSNSQGINDSILFDSSVAERNPGVHLVFEAIESDKEEDKSKPLESRKAEFTISKAEKLTYEPTVRRRCLRGLFMESSDSDPDDSEKPRRHGCRYNCMDKEFGEI